MLSTKKVVDGIRKEYPDIDEKQILKMAGAVSIPAFAEICLPKTVPLGMADVHYEIYENLMNPQTPYFAAQLPRGMAKSTVISFIYPLWLILNSPQEELVGIISEAASQSENFLSRIKNALTENDTIREFYGELGGKNAKRWRDNDIILANGQRVVALGTRQKIRGVIEQDTRLTVIIMDDFESELNADTPEARVKNRKWITEAVVPSLAEKKGKMFFLGTVISEDCFMKYCQKAAEVENSQWKCIWKAAIENEKSIWPELRTVEDILKKKAFYEQMGNPGGFWQEYMGMPQSPEDAPFKEHYFQTYDNQIYKEEGEWYLKEGDKGIPLFMFMGVDLASSLSSRADYTVLLTLGIDPDKRIFVVDMERAKSNPALHPDMIMKKFKKIKHKGVNVESIAYQESVRQTLRKMMGEEGIWIPGLERKITTRTSKSERLLSLVPYFAKKKVYFRPGDIEILNEFKAFPKGSHDDILDAFWLAITFSRAPSKKDEVNADGKTKSNYLDGWCL